MSYSQFIASMCQAEIQATTNGYKLVRMLGITSAGLRKWLLQGLPCERDEKNHLVIDIQSLICWLIETDRESYAGKLYDLFRTTN